MTFSISSIGLIIKCVALSQITMKGCTEITERSIHYITDGSLNLQDCQMTSSKVRAIPLKIGMMTAYRSQYLSLKFF